MAMFGLLLNWRGLIMIKSFFYLILTSDLISSSPLRYISNRTSSNEVQRLLELVEIELGVTLFVC